VQGNQAGAVRLSALPAGSGTGRSISVPPEKAAHIRYEPAV